MNFLICTDVAARGIDVKGLPFMINMTLPDDKANYVHRIGRVGRAERMGLAISLVSKEPEKVICLLLQHSKLKDFCKQCHHSRPDLKVIMLTYFYSICKEQGNFYEFTVIRSFFFEKVTVMAHISKTLPIY